MKDDFIATLLRVRAADADLRVQAIAFRVKAFRNDPVLALSPLAHSR